MGEKEVAHTYDASAFELMQFPEPLHTSLLVSVKLVPKGRRNPEILVDVFVTLVVVFRQISQSCLVGLRMNHDEEL